jgi:hypothetical protein
MRYRLMASYRGAPYEAGVGPAEGDVVLFAACPPPEELGFEPATGHWRKQLRIEEVQALWESRPVGKFRGERCIVLDDLGDRLHIGYLGHDAYQAEHLGYWQVDRGVFELVTPREEVSEVIEERLDHPLRAAMAQPPVPGYAGAGAAQDLGVIAEAGEPQLPLEAAARRAASARVVAPAGPAVPQPVPAAQTAPQPVLPAQDPPPVRPPTGQPARRAPQTAPQPAAAPMRPAPQTAPQPAAAPMRPAPQTAPQPAGPPMRPAPQTAPQPAAASMRPAPQTARRAPQTAPQPAGPPMRPAPQTAPQPAAAPMRPAPQPAAAPMRPAPQTAPQPVLPAQAVRPGPDSPPAARRRRSALSRQATQRIFSELASLAAIPPSAYAVGEEVDGAMCLVQTADGYEVFNAAAGARHEVRIFDDEESAYFYLFGVLAAEAVRTGRLAPQG